MGNDKISKLKEALRHPPPERLAKIEYQSHFLHILAVMVVSVILVYKGLWYIVFAFIFMIGVSYSQGMNAYARFRAIRQFSPMYVPDILDDPSPTRRRQRIINEALGKKFKWIFLLASVILAAFIIDPAKVLWYGKLAYFILAMFFWTISYYFVLYWIALPIYRKSKEVKKG